VNKMYGEGKIKKYITLLCSIVHEHDPDTEKMLLQLHESCMALWTQAWKIKRSSISSSSSSSSSISFCSTRKKTSVKHLHLFCWRSNLLTSLRILSNFPASSKTFRFRVWFLLPLHLVPCEFQLILGVFNTLVLLPQSGTDPSPFSYHSLKYYRLLSSSAPQLGITPYCRLSYAHYSSKTSVNRHL
jgi:hypothetical protein